MQVAHRRDQFVAHAIGRAQLEFPLPLVAHVDGAGLGAGKLRRLGADGVEHGLQIQRRVDRLGNLPERAQLLDRTGELGGARLHLVEQPHVLDRDHRLVGEGLDQLDLLIGERLDASLSITDHADRLALAQHRHTQHGA